MAYFDPLAVLPGPFESAKGFPAGRIASGALWGKLEGFIF